MGDSYWSRQQSQQSLYSSSGMLKRPRTEYDLPPSGLNSSHEMHNYLTRNDDRDATRLDTKTIGSAYDRYLQNTQLSSLTPGEASGYSGAGLGRAAGSGISGRPTVDSPVAVRSGAVGPDRLAVAETPGIPRSLPAGRDRLPISDHPGMARSGAAGPDFVPNGRNIGYGNQLPVEALPRTIRETAPLPPDATSTLYVEGLPPDSTRREVAHIFRPFVGYREVRLVTKESKHRGGDPLILCFVDFDSPACAATAMSALQGYKMDDHDPDSAYLRLQFSRFPGPRSGPGSRGKR